MLVALLACTSPPPDPSWPAFLHPEGPGLAGALANVRFGAPRSEVCPVAPSLCEDPAELRLSELPVRELQAAWTDGVEPGLASVVALVPDRVPDALVARWGPPTGDPPRWVRGRVRLRVDRGRGGPGHVTLWTEPALDLADVIGPGASFGTGVPLLGLDADGLRAHYGAFLVRSTAVRAWLHLWPLGDGFADVLLVADLAEGRVDRYTFDLNLGEHPDRAAVEAALGAALGAPTPTGDGLSWSSAPPVRLEGGLASVSVRVGLFE